MQNNLIAFNQLLSQSQISLPANKVLALEELLAEPNSVLVVALLCAALALPRLPETVARLARPPAPRAPRPAPCSAVHASDRDMACGGLSWLGPLPPLNCCISL